ncbi:MAG: enoyl-CoA hydratase/isomerase family protein [Candidatus Harrisonbacteria bacterium]|nr:enoyl-CoA hydratase/isomerase family protein [Candidatus Harrisonbacteria bacterium]
MLVGLTRRGDAGILKIQNPPHNILSGVVLREFRERLVELKNDAAVKVVVIAGQGIFSAGADVKEIYQLSQLGSTEKILPFLQEANDVVDLVENLGKPTIAAIDGICWGGGNELAMACSYRVAAKNAIFCQPEIGLGLIPGMGGTQRLPQLVGCEEAVRLMITGEKINAAKAQTLGLIDESVPDLNVALVDLLDHRREILEKTRPVRSGNPNLSEVAAFAVKSQFPQAADAILSAVSAGYSDSLAKGHELEQKLFAARVLTQEAQEAIARFLKIQPPQQKASQTEKNGDDAETLKEIRQMIREFAAEKIEPKIAQMEKERRILPELIKEMAELGFYGIPFSEKYGGLGLGLPGYCIVAEELARVHGSTAVMVGAHVSLACKAVYMFGTEEQKQKYLVSGIKGEKIGCYATTEPSVGSDLANIKTSAKKVDGGWFINGTKQFISNGAISDFAIVLAQTDPMGGNRTQAMFIVDIKSKGFHITKETEEKIGLHASCTSAFAMDDCFVPDVNLLGQVGQGFKVAMHVFNQSRISLGAGCVGAVKAAIEETIKYVKDRQIGGEPLWTKQLTQEKLGELEAIRYLIETLVYETARLYESGSKIQKEAAIVKYVSSEFLDKAINLALQVHGGSGYIEDYKIARLYRDSRVNRIFEGTSEVQLLLIAKELLKESL